MSLTGYSLLLLLIAVTNAVLGFGVAVLLGHGPRLSRISLPWRDWLQAALRWRPRWKFGRGRRKESTSLVSTPQDEEPPALRLTPIQLNNPPPAPAVTIHVTSELLPLDAALGQLHREVAAAREELGALDKRVRTCSESPTVGAVEECAADLKQTGARLHQQETHAVTAVQETNVLDASAAAARDEIAEFVAQRASELQQSLEQLDAWRVDPDNLADDCQRLLGMTEELVQSCDDVGQALKCAAAARNDDFDRITLQPSLNQPHAISQTNDGVARA